MRELADLQKSWGRYCARPTNNVMNVGMNYLSDLVVRPGIRKRLWPLLLYRGQMNPGHAHRLWNMVLLMMAAEAETLADGLKILNNPAFTQLCGPVRAPGKYTLYNFFGRLHDAPEVTELVPGVTEYVRFMGLGPCGLRRIDLETSEQYCAPWRISTHPDYDPKAERPESGVRALYYPYVIHEAGTSGEHDLVRFVHELVPAFLPDYIRADACQDLIVGLLAGDITTGSAHDWVQKYVSKVWQMHPRWFDHSHKAISFNQPVPGTANEGDGQMWQERV